MDKRDPVQADSSRDATQMRLQCIGSFRASTESGEQHTIEIWTHFGAVHDRDISRVEPTLLVLTTTEGYGVDRVSKGLYRLTENRQVVLATDDPNAP